MGNLLFIVSAFGWLGIKL